MVTAIKQRRPHWLKIKISGEGDFRQVKKIVKDANLHTVCESARCPNIGECWGRKTATFMILGDICTRKCNFCAVPHGHPQIPDLDEPKKIAKAISLLQLQYAVITSVTRDDLPDGGAHHFANTINEIRRQNPASKIEVLIPDFLGKTTSLEIVFAARPDILNHNTETVPSLYNKVRPQADYKRSLGVLKSAKTKGLLTKSGLMLGLGEQFNQVVDSMQDLRGVGCDILTIGQYMSPSKNHLPIDRFVHPDEFAEYKKIGREIGFLHVESGPLVRSSYHAEHQFTHCAH